MRLMAKKKATDGHKQPSRVLRMRQSMWDALDKLAERLGTDATHEMRNAIRERLEKFNLWPPVLEKPKDPAE